MPSPAIDLEANGLKSTQYAVEQALKQAALKPEARDLIERAFKNLSYSLLGILDDLPKIKGIRSAEGSEMIALIAQEALKHDPLVSRRALLKLRGQIAFRKQITESGGAYTTKEVAELLGISPGAVRKRLERGSLLAVSLGENSSYPVWQFDDNGIVSHFSEIMAMVETNSSVGLVQFFLTCDEDLKQTPIEALKSGDPDRLAIVRILAQQFNQQVAR